MSGRILIIDSVATNRTVLKAKMHRAQFSVDVCANDQEAKTCLAAQRPDLILINLADPDGHHHAFCKMLKEGPDTKKIAIIAVDVPDTANARLAALDAGVDDVLPRPVNDMLMLARIRSLLRVRNASQELVLRESTSRALGFEEASPPFARAAYIAVITPDGIENRELAVLLRTSLRYPLCELKSDNVLQCKNAHPVPDLFVLDGSHHDMSQGAFFTLVSDLRSRPETRHSQLLIIAPDDQPEIAAMFLDLGADDVITNITSAGEIALRAKALIRRKQTHDRLRNTLRDGLQAALTDPLTGLYNRRYVKSHLPRMAAQSQDTTLDLAVMILDIDHFKSVNDTYGHAAGDKVLVQIADRLRHNLRAVDLIARVGGEEFLVVMPGTTPAQAQCAANRLCDIINVCPFDLGLDHPRLALTISAGVAISDAHDMQKSHLDKIYDRADEALYAAKSAGRNQVAMCKSAA